MRALYLGAFLGNCGSTASGLAATDSRLSYGSVDLPALPTYPLAPGFPTPGLPTVLRPSIARTHKYMNINMFSISYVSRPRLRVRLTLGRLPLPRKPWVYGEQVSHLFYRYSCQHNHFTTVHHAFRHSFSPLRTLPYQKIAFQYSPLSRCLQSTHRANGHDMLARPCNHRDSGEEKGNPIQSFGTMLSPVIFSAQHH